MKVLHPEPRFLLVLLLFPLLTQAQKLPSFEVTPDWKAKIESIAPEAPAAVPTEPRKVLIFSLTTGFKHWCIPHTDAVVEILGEKTGAYESIRTVEIEAFLPENLARFDAVVLNNNCPDRNDRDIFRDVLINKMDEYGGNYQSMSLPQREALAQRLYESLVRYVANGGGLVLLHGAITNFNYRDDFSAMVGGSFDFHPPQQEVTLYPVDPDHPITAPFDGKPFVHIDEPYLMKGAYDQLAFDPLLKMDMTKLKPHRELDRLPDLPRYVAWIKPYQAGRVFFCSPSHNAQSFERPELLAFILNGMQYAIGDLAVPNAN